MKSRVLPTQNAYVYVLMQYQDYEGGCFLGAFSLLEKAKKAASELAGPKHKPKWSTWNRKTNECSWSYQEGRDLTIHRVQLDEPVW